MEHGLIQTKEERADELMASIDMLRSAAEKIDKARELYLGEHQARDYGTPVSRLLNWMQQSLTAIEMLIEKEVDQ